jgi:predicted metal-dependent RNase
MKITFLGAAGTVTGSKYPLETETARVFVDCRTPPRHVFVTHGEPVPADTIRQLTTERFGIPAHVPDLGETFDLD